MTIPPRAFGLDKRFFGVVSGICSDNVDPEHEGRIKVTFPWFGPLSASRNSYSCEYLSPTRSGNL